jgi:hypothetical protein
MNKILLAAIAGLTITASALAQGTLGAVNLNNNFTPPGGTTRAYVLAEDGSRLTAAVGMVEVLDSTGAVIKSGAISSLAGVFSFGVTDIPGTTAGGNGSIIIRAWDKTTGATFAEATSKGVSPIVTLTGLGGGTIPAPTLGAIGNFTGLQLVPEPSTVALAALGVLGLIFVARRK